MDTVILASCNYNRLSRIGSCIPSSFPFCNKFCRLAKSREDPSQGFEIHGVIRKFRRHECAVGFWGREDISSVMTFTFFLGNSHKISHSSALIRSTNLNVINGDSGMQLIQRSSSCRCRQGEQQLSKWGVGRQSSWKGLMTAASRQKKLKFSWFQGSSARPGPEDVYLAGQG